MQDFLFKVTFIDDFDIIVGKSVIYRTFNFTSYQNTTLLIVTSK